LRRLGRGAVGADVATGTLCGARDTALPRKLWLLNLLCPEDGSNQQVILAALKRCATQSKRAFPGKCDTEFLRRFWLLPLPCLGFGEPSAA
jgi:hypothetical protein